MEKETLLFKYFEGSLTQQEKVVFEQYLLADAEFKAQFELEKDVQAVVRDSERNILKKRLQDFESERTVTVSQKTNLWKPMRIAASIALLLGASWFVFNSGMFVGSEGIYDSNYEKYPNTVYTITRGDTTDNSLERQAFEAYERDDHQMAIHYFKELKAKTGLDYVDFYLGQAYLASGANQEAVAEFSKISSTNSDYKAEALWYEALAQVKSEKNKEAIRLLQDLLKDGSYKREEAKRLLEKLK